MFRHRKSSTLPLVLGLLLLAAATFAQESATPLLKLQSSKADLNLDTNVVHGQGMTGITYGKSGDVFSYPSSLACLVVYGDGKFVIEKREEPTLGKPKIKTAEGTLDANDLQHLKSILDDDNLKKIVTPKAPEMPNNATLREVESIDAQIDRAGTVQSITTIKERLKMGASEFGGVTNGMDTYLDNGAPFQKTLNPLLEWFEGLEKKNKSDFKDAKPRYCAPMNLG
ncbi:MAG: hypothetical protein WBW53_00560 [Terriglobales bacterium]